MMRRKWCDSGIPLVTMDCLEVSLKMFGGMNPRSRLEKEIALNILRINKATLETIRGESKK